MEHSKSTSTPLAVHPPLTAAEKPLPDPSQYRALVGSLQYLSLTHPNVSFSVNKLAQYMHCPTDFHMQSLYRLLRYLNGTSNMGLIIHKNSPLSLHAYSDVDWARDTDDFISTTAYIVYLGKYPISWSSRKQKTHAKSSTEAKYRAVAAASAELLWVQNLLHEL
ncbi:uncharacterized protein LOC110696710 [Chenopodium quinoa]|uniref:uncharacterized protein LOC110696710 n=1 Tax=Chenopodium quinoa TaxID=63459 RepID=UPI000B76DFC2|nr:uncharacterized protein LOC110696710 [Chenopodium quinoa]